MWRFRFCSSCSFLSLFHSFFLSLFAKLNLKTVMCMWILHIPNDCSTTRHLPFLVWGGVWAMTGELRPQNCQLLSPKMHHVLCLRLLGLLFNYSGHGTYRQVTPGLLNAWNSESGSLTIVSQLTLKTTSVQPKMLLYIEIPFGSPPRESVHFRGK